MRAWVGRYRSGTARSLPAVLAVSLLVGACTTEPEPLPPPPATEEADPPQDAPTGIRVGVVLPPAGLQEPLVQEALAEQLTALAEEPDRGVLQLRTHPVPSDPFVDDVVGWLAEKRLELVCVIGRQAEAAVAVAASLYRGVRFCALPAEDPLEALPPPDVTDDAVDGESTQGGAEPSGPTEAASDGVLRVGLRAAELGELVGVAAREQADGAPVGLVLGGGVLPADAFRSGLLAGLAGADVIEAGGAGRDVELADRAEAVVAAGAAVVVLDGAEGARAALATVGDRAAVFGPETLDVSRRPPLAVGWSVRWDRALAWPLAQVVEGRADVGYVSLGLRDGVFEVVPGPGASVGVEEALAAARARIIESTVAADTPATAGTGDLR